MDLIKGENAKLYMINHYNELLQLVNDDNNELYTDLEINIIKKLLFENIVNKINGLEKLSLNQAYFFVSKLVRYVSDALDIRIPCNFTIVESDDDRLPSDSLGVFRNDRNNNFEILYSKELLNCLCGLEKIDYEEGSEEYIQTMMLYMFFSLVSFPHELVHAKQFEERYTGEINFRNFILTLEHILCKGKYYLENVPFVYEECYAEVRAIDLLFEFLKKYNILTDIDVFDVIYVLMKKQYEQGMLSMKNYVVIDDGNVTDIITDNYLLLASVKIVGENVNFLNKFPLLKFVFSDKGDLLTVDSLLQKYMSIKDKIGKMDINDNDYINDLFVEIDNIYSFILKSYCFIYGIENVMEELKLYKENNIDNDLFVDNMLDMCDKLEGIDIDKINLSVKKRVLEMRK